MRSPGTRGRLRLPELLASRDVRRYLTAHLVGSTGTWMLRMAMDWLVLELTDSPAAVGVVVALQFLPLLVLGPLGGVITDRYDKRRLVLVTQAASAAIAAVLAVLALTATVTVAHLWGLAAALGVVAAVELPARQVLVNEVVGDRRLRSTISLTNALAQGGGLVGPALAGLVIAEVGEGWSFALNAVVGVAVVLLVASIRPAYRVPTAERREVGRQLREGFAFVTSRPHLLSVVALAGAMGVLGLNGPVVLAAFADEVHHSGARGFGVYNSLAAVGAVVGAVLAARLGRLRVRTVVLGAGAFGAAELVAALVPGEVAFMAMLVVVGATTLFFLTSAATWTQLAADPAVRGRVLAIYSPVLLGGHALGGLLQGRLAEELGVQRGLAVSGLLALVATGVVGLVLLRHARRSPLPHAVTVAGDRPAPRSDPHGRATAHATTGPTSDPAAPAPDPSTPAERTYR